jgi:hypothetical protein
MAENEDVKSKKDLVIKKLKGKRPEGNFEDEEFVYSSISEDFDEYENELAGYKEREGALSKMFTQDPRSATFLTDWRNGEDPTIGLVRKFGVEIKDVLDDPEMQEKIAEANKEYLDRVTENQKLEEEYAKNLEESIGNIQKFQEEQGYTDEQVDQAFEWLMQILHDGVIGKFSPEVIEMALKAQNYDNDVAQASAEGEVKGRNARIEETLRTKGKGDGTANIGGKTGKFNGAPTPSLGAIDKYADGIQNIWERGGEKRRTINQ